MQQHNESTPPTCAIEALTPIDGDDAITKQIIEHVLIEEDTVRVNCGTCDLERLFSTDAAVIPACFYLAVRGHKQG